MAIRLSGLTSGMDTDAIVQEMVKAYSQKTEKYEKASTKLTWKQDAWKTLNTKIYGLYTSASNMKLSGAYNLRKVSVSDNTKATITANSDAVKGTQKLNVLKTAQTSYLTGDQLAENITIDSKMSDLGYKDGESSIELRAADGSVHAIKFTKGTTLKEVLSQIKEAGYNAGFDENNKRIFISAKESGTKNDFNLYGTNASSRNALSLLGLDTALTKKEGDKISFTAAGAAKYQSGYDLYMAASDANKSIKEYIEEQIASYKTLQTNYTRAKLESVGYENEIKEYDALVARRDAKASLETIYSNAEAVGVTAVTEEQLRNIATELNGKEVTKEAILAVDDTISETDAENLVKVFTDENLSEDISRVASYKGEDLLGKTDGGVVETADELTARIDAINIEEIKSNLETVKGRMNQLQKDMNEHSYRELVEKGTTQEKLNLEVQKLVAEAEEAYSVFNDADSTKGSAAKIVGDDARIELNDVVYTSSSNNFVINGLSINVLAETKDVPVTITTDIDTQGVYDKIKDFLTEYNNVINEMCKLYNAESAKDYEPLTDEEKEAMSDEQIEKWETKIKDSLLRRDGTLNSIMSAMVNSMAQSFEIDGEKVSLSTFGISTLGFLNAPENEHYAFHIDGDEDDENTSGKKDKLKAAIETDPDKLMEFMKQLTGTLYSSIDEKMKSTSLSSAYKVYNDKEMDKELSRYAQTISKWEDKVKDKEDYYYKKFSQMEVALSKLQNQTSSISGLLNM